MSGSDSSREYPAWHFCDGTTPIFACYTFSRFAHTFRTGGAIMRPWVLMTAVLVSAATCGADNKKVANYPLRIRIFMRTATTFYQNRVAEEFKGEGRANLFEN